MNTLNKVKKFGFMTVVCASVVLTACSDDDDLKLGAPPDEHDHEVITDVTLIFTDTSGTQPTVQAMAQDPDGEGALPLEIKDTIRLMANTTYRLTYTMLNSETTPAEDIGAEVAANDEEHKFFYSFDNGVFMNPAGTGNIGGTSAINYEDKDENGVDVGLKTLWTTASTPINGSFRTMLVHYGRKTASSQYDDGGSDFDATFRIEVK